MRSGTRSRSWSSPSSFSRSRWMVHRVCREEARLWQSLLRDPRGAPGPAPATHHQGVHCGQAPDVSLGGSVYPGGEPRLQPAHQAVEHSPRKRHILCHSQPHLRQVASQRQGQGQWVFCHVPRQGRIPFSPGPQPLCELWELNVGGRRVCVTRTQDPGCMLRSLSLPGLMALLGKPWPPRNTWLPGGPHWSCLMTVRTCPVITPRTQLMSGSLLMLLFQLILPVSLRGRHFSLPVLQKRRSRLSEVR